MTNGFLPIVIFAGVVAAFAIMSLGLPRLVTTRRPTAAKRSPYESGVTPARLPAHSRFQVKFYIVAMLFILFDIEAIFLYPWAVAFRQLGLFGLLEMTVFIGLLFVAYVFVVRKGALDWSEREVPEVGLAGNRSGNGNVDGDGDGDAG
jgi:NADH-quinone oxidoreductase subunit A